MKLLIESPAGVREQERIALDREYAQRRMKRIYASAAKLTTWGDVRAGDHLLDCESGSHFFRYATVTGVFDRDSQGNPVPGDSLWVEYSGGGSREPRDGVVLIDRGSC